MERAAQCPRALRPGPNDPDRSAQPSPLGVTLFWRRESGAALEYHAGIALIVLAGGNAEWP